jgi:hypothetical protein
MAPAAVSTSAALRRWSWEQACARRLERHGLADPARAPRPAEAVDAICGAHAQVLTAGELSIGMRIAASTRADVQHALWTEHSLVKTFGPRGTVHLLPTEELPVWTGALSQLPQASGGTPPELRLSDEQTDQVVAAVADALADAELTMEELTEAVVARTGPWAGERVMPAFQELWPRWRQAVGTAARRGALCFGHNRGRRVTYTSPHRWLPGFVPAEARSAAGELARRYLRAYGPATPKQFAQWLGAQPRWAAELFEELGDELESVELGGSRAWLVAGDADPPAEPPGGLRLLPYFDAYTVGCHPRELLFPGRAAERALNRTGQAGNFPVLLLDGVVAGVWHQRRSGRRLEVTVEPLEPLPAPRRRELDQQVERLGEFLGCQPDLTIGAVTAGGHA